MRLSTSSSEGVPTRVSASGSGRSAAALLVAVLALSGTWEMGVRATGGVASVDDDVALWVKTRHEAGGAGPDALVVLGKSRVQLGFEPRAAREYGFSKSVFLPVHGKSAAATLQDLAADETFAGTVLMSLTEIDLTRGARDEQADYVAAAKRERSVYARVDTAARAWLQWHLASWRAAASWRHRWVRGRDDAAAYFFITRPERVQVADFGRIDAAPLREKNRRQREANAAAARRAGGVRPEPWLREALELEPAVRAIQKRGGRVVYLKFPAGAALDDFWEAHYPRATFWDALAARTEALTLHYRDLNLGPLLCPDESHIDASERARVTAAILTALAPRLQRRGTP